MLEPSSLTGIADLNNLVVFKSYKSRCLLELVLSIDLSI